MTTRTVAVRLVANASAFTAEMKKASASVEKLSRQDLKKPNEAFADLANRSAVAGLAIAAGIGVAVKRFADFDEAMSGVRANSGATGAELDLLRQSAIQLGADSKFTATEAADGINELAKAGLKTADIIGGGLKGSLDLAAAGQVEVGEAAETTATALTLFGLSGNQATHVADLLTNGANKAQGGVTDLGAALKQSGQVAAATGLTVDETAAALTAFANAGLVGSDAGTSFKTMLQRLSAPTDEAKRQMEALGISAYDSQGQFVGLSTVAGQLQQGMEDLTPAQRNAAMATIFGADAVRAANVLYSEGADGINHWTAEVTEQGAAARQAATQTDNLKGDIEKLGGAFDTVFIQTGGSANGALRTIVQSMEGLVETVGRIPGPLLLAGSGLAAVALVTPKAILSFRAYKASLESVGLTMDKITVKAPRTAAAMSKTGTVAKNAGKGFLILSAAAALTDSSIKEIGTERLTRDLLATDDAVGTLSASFKRTADQSGVTTEAVTSFAGALDAITGPGPLQRLDDAAGKLYSGLFGGDNLSDIAIATERFKELDSSLAGLAQGGNAAKAADLFTQITEQAKKQGVSVDELRKQFPQYEEALAAAAAEQGRAVGSAGDLTEATDGIGDSADGAKAAMDKLSQAIEGFGQTVADQRSAERDFQAAIDDATASIKENGRTLDVNSEAGRRNQAALDEIRNATLKKVQADYAATGSTESATKAMRDGRKAFIDAAIAAGSSRRAAAKLADQLGLIPEDVRSTISVTSTGLPGVEAQIDKVTRDRYVYIRSIFDPGTSYNGPGVSRAQGGPIYGPGTKTSDSILARVSKGEYVQRAAAVDKYGLAFMNAVNNLSLPAPGYANGGFVAPSFAPRQSTQVMTVGLDSAQFDRLATRIVNGYRDAAVATVREEYRLQRMGGVGSGRNLG